MALFIMSSKPFTGSVDRSMHAACNPDAPHEMEWHVGEPFPDDFNSPVVTFQADGHELDAIIDAFKLCRILRNKR